MDKIRYFWKEFSSHFQIFKETSLIGEKMGVFALSYDCRPYENIDSL